MKIFIVHKRKLADLSQQKLSFCMDKSFADLVIIENFKYKMHHLGCSLQAVPDIAFTSRLYYCSLIMELYHRCLAKLLWNNLLFFCHSHSKYVTTLYCSVILTRSRIERNSIVSPFFLKITTQSSTDISSIIYMFRSLWFSNLLLLP